MAGSGDAHDGNEASDDHGGESLAAVAVQLGGALDRAAEVPVACHARTDVAGWVSSLVQAKARIEALLCTALDAAALLGVPEAENQRSMPSVVSARTGADPRPVAADVRLGTWLRGYPIVADAFVRGAITRRHVEVLRALDGPRTRDHLADAQDYLVDAAQACGWTDFVRVVRTWELAFDPDGIEPVEQRANRSCSVRKTADGSVTGRFQLDPIAGQAFLTSLEQQEQRLYRGDDETGAARTGSQRRADALVDLVTRGAVRPDGSVPGPLVHVVFGAASLERHLGGGGNEGETAARRRTDDPDRRCELVDGTPIHPDHALAALAAASEVRRLVLDARSAAIDLGRRARRFPPHVKHALLAAARGRCQIPGCDSPPGWLQADHIHPWHRNGPTSIENGQILCDPHNKRKRDRPPAGDDGRADDRADDDAA